MKNSIILMTTFWVSLSISSCCTMKIAQCPDGRPVNFPKNQKCANKLYPDAIKTPQATIKATVNVLKKVTVGVDSLGFNSRVDLLKEKLDNESIRMELLVKSSYYGLVSDPCGQGENHAELLKSIAEKNYKIEELRVELEKSLNAQKGSKEIGKTLNTFESNYEFLPKPSK